LSAVSKSTAESLIRNLDLRWPPVAVKLVKTEEEMPSLRQPQTPLRHCQSIVTARKGRTYLLPLEKQACPDAASILGMSELPPRLADGSMYTAFQKISNLEIAQKMVDQRPSLLVGSIKATVVGPLASFPLEPDVVVLSTKPEQTMWVLSALSFFTGERYTFEMSSFNSVCIDATLIPYREQKLNISFTCYGCRAVSDLADEEMMVGIPISLITKVVKGLEELAKKAIPEARSKIYMPPF